MLLFILSKLPTIRVELTDIEAVAIIDMISPAVTRGRVIELYMSDIGVLVKLCYISKKFCRILCPYWLIIDSG